MLILLSSSKTMDFDRPLPLAAASLPTTQPALLSEANDLARRMRALSPQALGSLLELSDALRDLNFSRFQAFREGPVTLDPAAHLSRPALFAYTGDSYRDLDAATLSADDLAFAQAHLRTLSALYGALRPLDLIQPYRLEMTSPLPLDGAPSLAHLWRAPLTSLLNADLDASDVPLVVNLASNAYFNALDPEDLEGLVIRPVFQDWKDGAFKTIGTFAKRARGAMAGWIIRERIQNLDDLRAFSWGGYALDPDRCDDETLTFTRRP